ncbi:uncharacterized protein LOC131223669 isoform X4 [Magnolia sinica]|uniref:uncharacterized protein LOC131223669 isoform X4 n=1 Tax=Magnolia sinica TaxID=86752 RepID=UPI00265A579B|nr:uncharacterized protein LOC131223669 isoform X4 [Magnolia sinica]
MILCFLLASLILFSSAEPFDVRSHLSTASRYDAVKGINNNGFVASPIPAGCSVIHLNLVARHGTRSPTRKRIKELDRLATKLEVLLSDAKQKAKEGHISLQKIPDWLWGWQSPWKGKETGGELVSKGEEELYHLGIRTRERFPDLFQEEYHPDIFPIRATQVPRASASAVAFGMGLFSGKGSLGPGKHRAFAVISESRASDIYLRFHDTCENYKVALLEWTDDLEAFLLKGYGNSINYHMGVPLLQDVVRSMELAIAAKEENLTPGSSEKARLRFAHAETLIPFTCLLGLFREGSDVSEFERIQRMQPLEPPLKPPQKRNWRGSILAPFAGNNMLVLYGCPGNESKNSMSSGVSGSKYFVQVLHNEVPVPVPVCGNKDFFPFEDFKERIVNAYLEHNFDSLCNKKLEPSKVESLVPHPVSCKFSKYFRWLFMSQDDESHSDKHKTEL